jgi:mxaK protein
VRRRTVHALFGTIATICAVACALLGLRLHEALRINSAIASARVTAADMSVPQARLAQAVSLAEGGKFNVALQAYRSLLDAPDEVRLPALYDLANLNMREALKNGPGEAQRKLPLIELAKQSYRDVLHSNPADWDARYNLERALWLSPEFDDPVLERNQAPVHSEHAMSTLQGARIDLP